jgi:4-aminobutyrate aminotransferase
MLSTKRLINVESDLQLREEHEEEGRAVMVTIKRQWDVASIPSVYFRYFDVVFNRGEGAYVYAEDGRRWLDYSCGVGVTNTGHCHPIVVEAVREQAGKMLHCQLNIGLHEPAMETCTRTASLVGEGYACFLGNTGSEAIEGAVKLARYATGRVAFIAFEGGFHGRTAAALALTSSKIGWRAGYEPLLPGVFFAPYCNPLRSPYCTAGDCKLGCIDKLTSLFATVIHPRQVAAMIVEPILGEGGYVVPADSFLQALRALCDEHGILLIVDEVQSGYGRTGKMFAFEHSDIKPDIVVLSKGIASGLPLSAIVARRELMDQWPPGAHGGTYNGNIVACAAANATLDIFERERLVGRAAKLGEHLKELLAAHCPSEGVAEIRGRGLMIGIEFVQNGLEPDSERCAAVRDLCFEEGLLLLSAGTYSNVIRFIPPLVTTEEEIEWAVSVFVRAVKASHV